MRKILGATALLSVAILAPRFAAAETVYNLNQQQTGFTLPGVSLPQGQDEVRGADGTTCRSAVSGAGAYLDLGVIQGSGDSLGEVATYGRVVIPLGGSPKRLNCAKLYELEVERLQMELKLLKMGLAGQDAGDDRPSRVKATSQANWDKDGWSDGGKK